MICLGLLSIRASQETEYFTEIAKRSHLYNIQVVRFTPMDINPITEMITGLSFDSALQAWKKTEFPIPSFLYDRCFYNHSKSSAKAKPIVDWLKKRPQTTFLGHGLPDKLQLYHVLSEQKDIAPYIARSEAATEELVWKRLTTRKEIVLKPLQGSQGNGICQVTYGRNGIQIAQQCGKEIKTFSFHDRNAFTPWISTLLQQGNYFIQPFLFIQDQHERPFDIRILLQKNQTGQWQETGRGVRIAPKHTLVSNLHAGSQVFPYDTWKQTYSSRDILLLEDAITTLLKSAPLVLETTFAPLFELGLDISFDKDRAVWLLDVNSKPGRKVILEGNTNCAETLYRAPLAYVQYLQSAGGVQIR